MRISANRWEEKNHLPQVSKKADRQSATGKTKCLPGGILFSFKVIGQRMIADKIAKVAGHFYSNPFEKTSIKRTDWPVHRAFGYF